MVITAGDGRVFVGGCGVGFGVVALVGAEVEAQLLGHEFVVDDVLIISDVSSAGFLEESFIVQQGENSFDFLGK